jgi:hypothetical protein
MSHAAAVQIRSLLKRDVARIQTSLVSPIVAAHNDVPKATGRSPERIRHPHRRRRAIAPIAAQLGASGAAGTRDKGPAGVA